MINRRLNALVIGYVLECDSNIETIDIPETRNQFTWGLVSDVINKHIKVRLKLIKISDSLPFSHHLAFGVLSILHLYTTHYMQLLKSILKLGRRIEIPEDAGSLVTDLAIGFPSHSFSIPNNYESRDVSEEPFSSFAEFLISTARNNEHRKVVSVAEYTRNSKKHEQATDETLPNPVRSLNRTIARNRGSFFSWISDATAFFSVNGSHKWLATGEYPSLLRVKTNLKLVESFRYFEFISRIEKSGGKVRRIYAPPFFDSGLLAFDKRTSDRLICYSYSSNTSIPPSPSLPVSNCDKPSRNQYWNTISDMGVSSLCLFGKAVGFTDMFAQLDRLRREIREMSGLRLALPENHDRTQNSAVLGFEQEGCIVTSEDNVQFYIGVFDTPPESEEKQLSRTIIGDKTCDIEFVENFLTDIVEVAKQLDCRVIFKPKYSIKNYPPAYSKLIESLAAKHKNGFTFLNPYTRLGDVIEQSDVVIAMPYTSVYRFALDSMKNAFYYVPDSAQGPAWGEKEKSELLAGKALLEAKIRQLLLVNNSL